MTGTVRLLESYTQGANGGKNLVCLQWVGLVLNQFYPTQQKFNLTLDSVAQLVGTSSHNQRVAGSIPGQGTYLGRGFDP